MENKKQLSGTRDFEVKEAEILTLTRQAVGLVYPIYWFGLEVAKDMIELLIEEHINRTNTDGHCCKALLIILNRAVQHIESIRILVERGFYGDSFSLLRNLTSDLSMMQYLHFHPELIDLFLNEKSEDYKTNKIFKAAFSEAAIEKDLVSRNLPPFDNAFRLLSKASHTSAFGSQLYGTRISDGGGEYGLNYGPIFQADRALVFMDLLSCSYYDLVCIVLWHRFNSDENLMGDSWDKVKNNLEKLKLEVKIFTEIATKTYRSVWPQDIPPISPI